MTPLESRLFAQSFVAGIICTLIVVTAEALGLFAPPEEWLYDKRSAYAQFATPAPSKQIVHLDIDDAALDALGRWPWPRATLARILDEVHLARPSAVGLDILFPEPQSIDWIRNPDGSFQSVENDPDLSGALRRMGVAVLAAGFHLGSEELTWPMLDRVVACLKSDLELTPAAIAGKLGPSRGSMDEAALDDLFVHARRLAMRERIDEELEAGRDGVAELKSALLPHTDPNIDSPLTRLLTKQYVVASADRSISRFGAPAVAMTPPPLQGSLEAVPLSTFSDAVAGVGFANYDIFDNKTVRSIPLIVQYKNKLYPQIGLAVACVAMGADPKKVRFEHDDVIIPTRSGVIAIPTYTYHSNTTGEDVPLIAAIPWFGGQEWETMYDWPAHRDSSAYMSIASVWDICLTQDIIARNSAQIDKGFSQLLDEDLAHKLTLGLDPALGKKYAAARPDPQDIDAREAMIKLALKELDDAGWAGAYDNMAEKDMTPEDKLFRDTLHDAVNALKAGIANSRDAQRQLIAQRQQLAQALRGKAIFVGFTAVGFEDRVSTPLHLHCPGVVVHGVIASAVMTGLWWRMAPNAVTLIMTLMLGVVTAWAQGRLSPVRAGVFALGLALTYWIFNWGVLFGLERYLVGTAAPLIVIAVVWAVCAILRLFLEGIERIRIGTENEVFQKEMNLARKVQFALVPKEAPEMTGINADGWTLPADLTGGDLFDLWKLPDGRLGILVADASGHGLAPAMIVSQVRTLVHMMSEYEPNPHNLLRRVNTRLALDLETGRFVTAFLAFLKSDGEFEWASAGHGPMYWCPTGEGELLELDSSGLPLGVQEDWLADDPTPPLKMEVSGRLIVFSDGIFEAHAPDPKAGLFGTDAIKDILHNACHASSSEIIHLIREAVQKFQQKKEPIDDQTIVVVRRVPPESASIDGEALYNISAESAGTVTVPVSSDFEISVDNPVLETPTK
jgi:CHASE2 domain-containing sensor protein